MLCGPTKVRRYVLWYLPLGTPKFNVDGVARSTSGMASIGGILRNDKGEVLLMFSKHVSVRDSNEVEALAIFEALWCFSIYFQDTLIVENDSSNTIS